MQGQCATQIHMMIAVSSGTCMEMNAEIVDEVTTHGGTEAAAELLGLEPRGAHRSGKGAEESPSSLPPV